MKKNVLSLFDGMSCCQLALIKLGIKFEYFASEVDKYAMEVTQKNFPNTKQLGDVRNINVKDLPTIWAITAGSPCQSFSMAGKRKGMMTEENVEVTSLSQYLKLKREGFQFVGQSHLFWEFVRILRDIQKLNPDVIFLFENVKMPEKWEAVITKTLGVEPIRINSSLVSGQHRERLYWTNLPVSQPEDKGIMLSDIIPGAKGHGVRGRKIKKTDEKYVPYSTTRVDGKANCLVTSPRNTNKLIFKNGNIRVITPTEAEKLQTVPVGYTNVKGISPTQRYKMLGNGWTIDVITHILKKSKKYSK
jgi:DNA (cytosine-5)-methyltransferase 3A